ncbi:deoxycytidyl transferase [Quaeritorhiza haematococci]|nr:deoxycytidyl transferase [Quaeritorhiza haematococci]
MAYPGGFREYMQVKRRKLQLQNDEHAAFALASTGSESLSSSSSSSSTQSSAMPSSTPPLFSKLQLHFDGYTGTPALTALEFKKVVLKHGARVHDKLEPFVTHIIATQMTDSKIRQLRKPVVRPEWLIDSIEKGKLLDWRGYKLYFELGRSQRTIVEGMAKVAEKKAAEASQTSSMRSQGSISRDRSQNSPSSSRTVSCSAQTTKPMDMDVEVGADGEVDDFFRVDEEDFVIDENATGSPRAKASSDENAGDSASDWFGPRPSVDMNSDWVKANISTAPDFLNKFFGSSRLHHLSSWKNDLRDFVAEQQVQMQLRRRQQQREAGETVMSNINNEPDPSVKRPRTIMHIDMDCFFASIAIRDRPALASKPVAIAHSSGTSGRSTSEIASCNYVARASGVRNGMSIGRARALCPALNVLPYEFDKYDKASRALYCVLLEHADVVQAVSCDEAFVDVTAKMPPLPTPSSTAASTSKSTRDDDDISPGDDQTSHKPAAVALAESIRARVAAATGGCTASIGISHNILLARMATKRAKPNGVHFIARSEALSFLSSVPVDDLPGVGWSLTSKLRAPPLNIETCSDLRTRTTLGSLQKLLGTKTGLMLYNYARGIDNRVLENKERRSIGAEVNWGVRFENEEQVEKFVRDLAGEVARRMEAYRVKGRQLTMKVKRKRYDGEPHKILGCGDCDNLSRSLNLARVTDDANVIARESLQLMKELKVDPVDIRGVGIHFTKLDQQSTNIGGSGTGGTGNDAQKTILESFSKQQQWNARSPTSSSSRSLSVSPQSKGSTAAPAASAAAPSKPVSEVASASASPQRQKPPQHNQNQQLYHIRPADIDPDVWRELPPEIQAELAPLFNQQNQNQNQGGGQAPVPAPPKRIQSPLPTAGPSRPTTAAPSSSRSNPVSPLFRSPRNPTRTNTSHKPAVIMSPSSRASKRKELDMSHLMPTSASQVDPEVLESLPEIIRREIRAAMKGVRGGAAAAGASHGVVMVKGHSSSSWSAAALASASGVGRSSKAVSNAPKGDGSGSGRRDENETGEPGVTVAEKPSFCGLSDVEDVRGLLDEWLATAGPGLGEEDDDVDANDADDQHLGGGEDEEDSSKNEPRAENVEGLPLPHDIDLLKKYLIGLVESMHLETAQLILSHVFKRVREMQQRQQEREARLSVGFGGSEDDRDIGGGRGKRKGGRKKLVVLNAWARAMDEIFVAVDGVVEANYGGSLKMR